MWEDCFSTEHVLREPLETLTPTAIWSSCPNFSILETAMGDYRLSPAYDLLNSRIHVEDNDFALDDGLLPKNLAQGRISAQFAQLAKEAEINEKMFADLRTLMLSKTAEVEKLVAASFLHETTKRTYLQHYYGRIKQFTKP